jgi:hypothetical protein
MGWIFGSPLATSEGGIDIVTNVREEIKRKKSWKTGGIGVRHFEDFWERVDTSCKGNWVLLKIGLSNTFYICPSHRRIAGIPY